MDPRRLRPWEWLAGALGVGLLLVTFLGWYGAEGGGETATAWESFSVVDVVLALAAIGGIAVAVVTAWHGTPALPIALASLLALVGTIATILVLWRALSPPGDDLTREAGLWLGLAGCVGLTAAAFASMRDERFPKAARLTPPVETLPPPEGDAA